ncbi:MerR family transcriptional regulator [Cyanobacterium sp. DS4]|uniref:MerR family transcriptional regulator n=1 Tax=Cyanobacterium sp. DS4 TaxID=2878255 RepID=UPI002E811C63|nr:MerR family transcriptional regulator [Cyanobacterium sp. Dongsha4]WVL00640.1 MerR family transcriptional regulator [Cyanobacterium sp. Dongsha4]
MDKQFFTSKEAATIAGLTYRQVEYWRKKEIIVPTVNTEGSGHNVYYSLSELWQLALMGYLLDMGLDFKVCSQILGEFKERHEELMKHPLDFPHLKYTLCPHPEKGLTLTHLSAIEITKALMRGESILMLWTENVNQRLIEGLSLVLTPKKNLC